MVTKEDLVAAGCRVLEDTGGKIIVSCPKERLDSGLMVKEKPLEIERNGSDAILTFRKEAED